MQRAALAAAPADGGFRLTGQKIFISAADIADYLVVSARSDRAGEHFSLRWIVAHMIEETGRHAGHADILRELIDGRTGE